VGTRSAYAVLILGNAASFLGCALLVQRVPAYEPLPRAAHHRHLAAMRDKPFLSFAAVNGAMGLQYPTVALLLAIWIAAHTRARNGPCPWCSRSARSSAWPCRLGSAPTSGQTKPPTPASVVYATYPAHDQWRRRVPSSSSPPSLGRRTVVVIQTYVRRCT